jgi:hypothetical protein
MRLTCANRRTINVLVKEGSGSGGGNAARLRNLRSAMALLVQDIRQCQRRYMPELVLADDEMEVGGHPELSKIFLPSELDLDRRNKCCPPRLVAAKVRLRTSAAFEALEEVRQHIRMQGTLEGLNVKDTASSTAAKIQNRLEAFAVAAGGSGDADENDGQRDGVEEVLEEGIHLTGAVSHGQQRRGVSWIWLGANLKRGEDNGDPEGLSLASLLLLDMR